jgi:hypothetical protein
MDTHTYGHRLEACAGSLQQLVKMKQWEVQQQSRSLTASEHSPSEPASSKMVASLGAGDEGRWATTFGEGEAPPKSAASKYVDCTSCCRPGIGRGGEVVWV